MAPPLSSILIMIYLLVFFSILGPPTHGVQHRQPKPHVAIYKDSVAFKAAFAQLFPIVRPTPNVRESAERMLGRMGRMLRARGIDSARAYDSVMRELDPHLDHKLLYDAYRKEFSAKELQALVTFFQTPVGKHFLEVEGPLYAARTSEIQQAIARTIYRAITPMVFRAAKHAAAKRSIVQPGRLPPQPPPHSK